MIRKTIFFVVAVCICFTAKGQTVPGNTDTSFSTYSAYKKVINKYPHVSIVQEIQSNEINEEKGIVYYNRNGRKLLLDVFSPADKINANNIAIIIIHGGGWRSGNRMQHYPLAQRLTQSGYTCFTIEYRLSTEALYPAAIVDSKEAIKWVRKNAANYNIDSTKIAVLGFSAGGEIATFIATTANKMKFEEKECHVEISAAANAVIDIDGTLSFVHPESSEGNDSKKLSAATQWFGVAKKDSFKLWEEASPLTHVNKSTPPTLFINSSVPAMHAGREDYLKVLKKHNIYSEVHSFENSPHTFCLFHPWFEPTVKYVDDFLKKILIK